MSTQKPIRIGLVVPHIFMQDAVLPQVIFSPGTLALGLAEELQNQGADVTLFSPGKVTTSVKNINADMSYFGQELAGRGDTYVDLLKKHPVTFISMARQVQSELVAKAFAMANSGQLDVVHIYTNEEDIALPFVQFCRKPVVLTHHDPFTFLVKYKNVFPKYKHLNWLSVSLAQRAEMPLDTNWVGNIYHGLAEADFAPNYSPDGGYVAFLGRIIQPKGMHLAIEAVEQYNKSAAKPLRLKIAGKHYAGEKDTYWQRVAPLIDGKEIEYVGFVSGNAAKQEFLGNARALVVPSLFAEPFGMVAIEAMACGTPVVGLDSGALPEVIQNGKNGFVIPKKYVESAGGKQVLDDQATAGAIAQKIAQVDNIDRQACRRSFEQNFTLAHMAQGHLAAYRRVCG
ncbi:MAG TPA: glycosyltransferase [Patescibacteria group bacterium]|nr:glycosyltransferase [Patescibacteria group bacterium]